MWETSIYIIEYFGYHREAGDGYLLLFGLKPYLTKLMDDLKERAFV
jgi:hypothetical protein